MSARRSEVSAIEPPGAERVAFVLTGGASHGAVQVGMLQALTHAGVTPDVVVGVSAGALNGVAFAADPTMAGLERLATAWRTARRSQIFSLVPSSLVLGGLGRRDHLVPNRGLRRWIERHLDITRLEDAVLPVHAVATEVGTGMPVLLSEGSASEALLASCAIPGVFPPVEIGGRLLVDGGVAADAPVPQAEALGATTIYVLPAHGVTRASHRPRSAVAMGIHAIGQLLVHATRDKVAAARTATVRVLPAPPTSGISPFDLSGASELIDAAYGTTRAWLDEATGDASPLAVAS
jgi:NTE family protein